MDKSKSFSERMGYKPIKEIQENSMDEDLRIRLWNALYGFIGIK